MDLNRLTWAMVSFRDTGELVRFIMYDHSPTGRLIDTRWRIAMTSTNQWQVATMFQRNYVVFDTRLEAQTYAEVTYGLQ